MWLDFEGPESIPLKEPAMVVAVSTSMPQYRALYSQAREMGEYMVRKMGLEMVATVRSSAFPPEVLVRDEGVSSLPKCGFYRGKGKRDILLFAGDTSPMDEQYEFAQFLLGKAESLGVKEVYSVGARWAENPASPDSEPLASGFSTDAAGVSNLKKHGVRVLGEEPAPFFASMVVAMAGDFRMRGYKLSVDHGEPSPHTRSVIKLLEILGGMAGFEIDLSELRDKVLPARPPRQSDGSSIYH
jgi:proteasome assembly chaperone (PAC2) family protein